MSDVRIGHSHAPLSLSQGSTRPQQSPDLTAARGFPIWRFVPRRAPGTISSAAAPSYRPANSLLAAKTRPFASHQTDAVDPPPSARPTRSGHHPMPIPKVPLPPGDLPPPGNTPVAVLRNALTLQPLPALLPQCPLTTSFPSLAPHRQRRDMSHWRKKSSPYHHTQRMTKESLKLIVD